MKFMIDLYRVSQIGVYTYFSATKWDRSTIYVMFYSLNFHKPVHIHILPQYTPNTNDVEQSDV